MNPTTILVVEDEGVTGRHVQNTLVQLGYAVPDVARTGEEALDLVERIEPDLVLMDTCLSGGMDGIETVREIKRVQPLVEVILLTGHASVETSIEGMKQGAFDYLLKPMKFEELLTKMAQAFEKKAAHDSKIRDAKIQELIRYPSRVFDQEK